MTGYENSTPGELSRPVHGDRGWWADTWRRILVSPYRSERESESHLSSERNANCRAWAKEISECTCGNFQQVEICDRPRLITGIVYAKGGGIVEVIHRK